MKLPEREEREAREKGLQLVARIEQLYHTDEELRHWYPEGIDEIESGHFVTFSEDGWEANGVGQDPHHPSPLPRPLRVALFPPCH